MTTSAAVMKLVKRRDRNTRALAKVVSAIEWVKDIECDYEDLPDLSEAAAILEEAKFQIVQERRNLNVALWKEVDQQR